MSHDTTGILALFLLAGCLLGWAADEIAHGAAATPAVAALAAAPCREGQR